MSDSNFKDIIRIKGIANYTQQYVDGTLILTPIKKEPIIELLDLSCINSTEIHDLPSTLKQLICFNNYTLEKLPDKLPEGLENLTCIDTLLTELPEQLPQTLTTLWCVNNKIKKLPEQLPEGLIKLYCNYNNLTSLPASLPPNLKELCCCNNDLTILPDLPETLTVLDIVNNNFEQLYPDYNKCYNLSDVVKYINRRNREMREEPAIIDEHDLINNPAIVIHTCMVKKNNTIISDLSYENINYKNIAIDIYRSFGINLNLINTNAIFDLINIINMIKSNDQMSINLVCRDINTNKKYRYIYCK